MEEKPLSTPDFQNDNKEDSQNTSDFFVNDIAHDTADISMYVIDLKEQEQSELSSTEDNNEVKYEEVASEELPDFNSISVPSVNKEIQEAQILNLSEELTDISVVLGACVTMAVESWRFMNVFKRIMSKLPPNEGLRFAGQLRFFEKKLNEALNTCNLKLVNFEGKHYDPGLPVTAINLDDFPDDAEELLIERMIEPVILDNEGKIIKLGTVQLFSKESIK